MENSKYLKHFSEFSLKLYGINENVIELNGILEGIDAEEQYCIQDDLDAIQEELLKLYEMSIEYISDAKDDKWVFEIDKKVIEIILGNIKNKKSDSVIYELFDKHRIHIKCFPFNSGMRFYCPICEQWHTHGSGNGGRVPHCINRFYRGGEEVKRDNPLSEHDYVIEMMSVEDLTDIRNEINVYLKYLKNKK